SQNEEVLPPTLKEITKALGPQRDAVARAYVTLDAAIKAEVAGRLGVNEFAAPRIGDAFVVFSTGAKRDDGVLDVASNRKIDAKWGQHWGGVVAASGGEYLTFENYDRQAEDARAAGAGKGTETRAFFMMYGPAAGQTGHDTQR